jgi:hypothetical protein
MTTGLRETREAFEAALTSAIERTPDQYKRELHATLKATFGWFDWLPLS